MFIAGASFGAGLNPVDLVCDGWENPIGIDQVLPKLSWVLEAQDSQPDVSQFQSAYQILVASTQDQLAVDNGDLWDSGKVESGEQLDISFDGSKLGSAQQVYWKVRVWDENDLVGDWSEVQNWTMGLLNESDWGSAEWISHPDWLAVNRAELGYKSRWADTEDCEKWVMIDLGEVYPIDQVRLFALRHTVAERLGFPLEFKVELSVAADFEEAVAIADYTTEPFSNIWIGSHTFPADQVQARYVKVTAPKLRKVNGQICLAFNQIEVVSDGENVAKNKTVTASDLDSDPIWSLQAVVDGKGLPSSNPLSTKTFCLKREVELTKDLKRATLFVAGLGQYVAKINGERVGDFKLHPGWSDTDKAVFYDGFDLTESFQIGVNELEVQLANGFFNVGYPRRAIHEIHRSLPSDADAWCADARICGRYPRSDCQ